MKSSYQSSNDTAIPNGPGARRPRQGKGAQQSATTASPKSEMTLVVVRESALYAMTLFIHMLIRTLEPHAKDNPDCAKALELGLRPMQELVVGDGIVVSRLDYNGREIPPGQKRRVCAYLFQIGKTVFVYSMSSAATSNTDHGLNAITQVICDTIRIYRPRMVVANSITRYLRCTRHGAVLQKTIQDHKVMVVANELGGKPLDLSDSTGYLMWHVLALMAAWERDQIVYRTTVGKVMAIRDGRCPIPEVPPGYEKTPDGRLVVSSDPAEIELVRSALRLYADGLNLEDMARLLSERQLHTRGLRRRHGAQSGLHHAAVPSAVIGRVCEWAAVLRDLTWHIRLSLPQGLDGEKIPGLTVLGSGTDRHMVETLRLPEPPGGWGNPDVLDAAVRRLSNETAIRANASKDVQGYPLVAVARQAYRGLRWHLRSVGGRYEIRTEPK